MKRIARTARTLASAGAFVALGVAFQAQAQAQAGADPDIDRAPSGEAMTFDLFVMRPLGLVGTVAGAAVYIVSLPFDVLTWNFAEPARRLIGEPARFTFTRALGDLD